MGAALSRATDSHCRVRMNPPTIVRLLGFPEQVRLSPRGSREETSGVVVVTDRDADVEVTLRLAHSTLTFGDGETQMQVVERVEQGDQHEILFDWSLSGFTNAPYVMFEIDVRYAEQHHVHTATAIVGLEQRERSIGTAIAIGGALVAAALGLVALARPRVEVREFTVDAPPEPPRPASTTSTTTPRPSSSKKSSAKSSAKKSSSSKTSAAKKTTGGGARPGSAASGSAQRTGARGSSAGRKSAPARSTRKSR